MVNSFRPTLAAYALPGLFLLILSYFALFHHLGWQHMNAWDESSYALNAEEMAERGNLVEVYLLGNPDLYNTKPPFAIWCMALCVKMLGFTEKAIRLPSATFAFLAVVVLYLVGIKWIKNKFSALAMPMVLLSSTGFIGEHTARTGDTDVILACWILVYCLCFYTYTTVTERKSWWLLFACISISLACLTKGIAGLSALPGLLFWALYTRQLRVILRSKAFYAGLLIFLLLVPGYYLLRNYYTPGYIDTVLHFEVGGRLAQQEFLNPEYRPYYWYYQAMFTDKRLVVWLFVLPVAILIILWSEKSETKQLALFFLAALIGVSLSLAISKTKLFWYDAPLYPLIAGVIGSAVAILFKQVKQAKYQWVVAMLLLGIFAYPYSLVAERGAKAYSDMHAREGIRAVRNELNYKDTLYIAEVDINFAIWFYIKQDSLNGNISRIAPPSDTSVFKPGRYFLTCKYAREVDMHNLFILDTLYRYDNAAFFRIRERKQPSAINHQ